MHAKSLNIGFARFQASLVFLIQCLMLSFYVPLLPMCSSTPLHMRAQSRNRSLLHHHVPAVYVCYHMLTLWASILHNAFCPAPLCPCTWLQ